MVSVFRSRFQKSRNLSNLCLHSYIRYNRSATPICDKASGKQHICPITKRCFLQNNVHTLFNRKTFSGKGTFIDLKACIFNQSSIGRDHITCFKKDHISYNQFSCRELYRHTIT